MSSTRRAFLGSCLATTVGGPAVAPIPAATEAPARPRGRTNPIAVSTYSFWRFEEGQKVPVHRCIDLAARWGFDAVEILEVQMERKDPATLAKLKRRALKRGLDLCGLSTHQGFVDPDPKVRQKNVERTRSSIDLAYRLGIPVMRVNTGRWGTIESFDKLMANRGKEPSLPGHDEEDAFAWVVESLKKCLPLAEKRGVLLGLENHWGLARTPEGLLRIVEAVDSPWLAVLMDTGNFLEDPYDALKKIAPYTAYVHAKTYDGGGKWYTLDLDYGRIADLLGAEDYAGYVSLEFEGRAPAKTAIPAGLARLERAFAAEEG